jgi:hypothetical protein
MSTPAPLDIFSDRRGDSQTFAFKVRRRIFAASSRSASSVMACMNRLGHRRLVGASTAPVVSLTSYGPRVSTVSRTIESIGRGTTRPSRIILFLDDPAIFAALPQDLERQRARGLEIVFTENLGPHTKYYPLIQELSRPTEFATVDDDIIYPRWWLSRLIKAARDTPGQVVCHRAHRMTVVNDRLERYVDWPSVTDTRPHHSVFATGVSGVLYPPDMVRALRAAGRAFERLCPTADDVWLHHVALDNGIPVRQVADIPKHFWITPHSQSTTLMDHNLVGGNDRAIDLTYSPGQVQMLAGHGAH